jgi:hypothetical protein
MSSRLTALFFLMTFLACDARQSHDKAISEWRHNEEIVNIAISKGDSDADQYLRSVTFFQSVTGIVIRGNAGTFGLVPNQYTAQDLASIKQWCKKNCRGLYWDEETQSVKLTK